MYISLCVGNLKKVTGILLLFLIKRKCANLNACEKCEESDSQELFSLTLIQIIV